MTYCTSYVTDSKAQRRQNVYLQALETRGIEVLRGSYEIKPRVFSCTQCGKDPEVGFPREKPTDVNLAVGILLAASRKENPAEALLRL